jgi:DNA-binding NarL/FixJ family response regulator
VAQLKAGETVLVLGAAGGVGTAALQIAKAMGAPRHRRRIQRRKVRAVPPAGRRCHHQLQHAGPARALKALTGGKGPDVVYDPVGGDLAEPAFRSIAWRGRYLVIGFAGGGIPALPWNLALLKGASVVGVFWGDFVKREPRPAPAALMQLAQWYAKGKHQAGHRPGLPMSELKAAYTRMGSRQVRASCCWSTLERVSPGLAKRLSALASRLQQEAAHGRQGPDPRRQPGGPQLPVPRGARKLQRRHHHHRSRRPGDRAPHIALTGGSQGLHGVDPFKLILVDLELPDGNGMELLAELVAVPGHQDRHHAVFRRRPPVPRAAVRRRRLPAEGRPLRSAGRGTAEDRARPATAVARPSRGGCSRTSARAATAMRRRRTRACAASSFSTSRPVPIEKPLDHERLTPRESEVLTYLSKGFTIKEIASLMGIKWFTVNDHIKSIYKKLNVSSRAEAAVLASKQGLV